MRWALLLLVAICLRADAPTTQQFATRVMKFQNAYVKFLTAFCGWKLGELAPQYDDGHLKCTPSTGHIDYGEFGAARKEAKILFEFVE